MPFLSPNQQCQTTDEKSITFHGHIQTSPIPVFTIRKAPGYLEGGMPTSRQLSDASAL